MSRKSRRAKPAGAGVGAQHGTSGPAAEHGRRGERRWIAAFCLAAAARVFLFSAAFPFFNNVDEKAHVDMVVKFARGHWPSRPLEHFDPGSARLFLLYDSHEYLDTRTPSPIDMDFLPLWTTPAFADEVLSKGVPVLAQENNHEVNSPPVYYAVAGAWYDLGRALGLPEGQQLYWIRFLNVPVVVLLVVCAYVFCRDCFPGRTDLRLGVPALVAFIPQDLFYSVNSDVLSPLLNG